jgi:hypothetical protein
VFPGDIGLTLHWKPETNLAVIRIDGEISSHALVGAGQRVRVIPAGESWPVGRVKVRPEGEQASARPTQLGRFAGYLQQYLPADSLELAQGRVATLGCL